MSYCPSKKNHLFPVQFRAWIMALHAPDLVPTEQCCSNLAASLNDHTPLSAKQRGCVDSAPGEARPLLQFNYFPLKYSPGGGSWMVASLGMGGLTTASPGLYLQDERGQTSRKWLLLEGRRGVGTRTRVL